MQKELRVYRTKEGKEPFTEWLNSFKDKVVKAQIANRLHRLALGHYGDYHAVGSGVHELRIHYGAGYRIYFVEHEKTVVLLLIGGSKSTQKKDIQKAIKCWLEFRERCYD